MTTCLVTGHVVLPDGTPYSGRITFKRLGLVAAYDDGGAMPVIIPDAVTASGGTISVALYPGTYSAAAGTHTFKIGVPQAATADFAACVGMFPAITSTLTQTAIQARNVAVAASGAASASADQAAASASSALSAAASAEADALSAAEAAAAAEAVATFTSRADLVAYVASNTPVDGREYRAGGLSYLGSTGATAISDLAGLVPVRADVRHWGAIGDWDGLAGADDTAAIDAALDWWAGATGRHLHFSEGWYFYTGANDLDLGGAKFNKITMDGRLWHGAGNANPIAWTIHNAENLHLDLKIQGGGQLGNFTVRVPGDGGTTFLKVHDVRWVPVLDIEAMDYAGRVLHTTAEATVGTARARNMNIHLTTGNRTTNPGNVRCGQPIYADSNICEQTGSWGKVTWRGEGTMHGPVFERLNDVRIPDIEAGLFVTSGMEFRGCVVVIADNIYTGQSDNALAPGVSFIPTSAGRKCGDIHIKTQRSLTATRGLYAKDLDPSLPGLRVDSLTSTASQVGLWLEDVHSATIGAAGGSNLNELVRIAGACGNIEIRVDETDTIANDVVNLTGTVSKLTLSGKIDGGAATYSLVNLGANNNKVNLFNLDLESAVAAQLVNIGFAGSNKVRMIGGYVSISGSTTVFNSPRRAEYIKGVRGYQTEATGSATILNGTSTLNVTHNIDANPQIVTLMATGPETAGGWVTGITATQFTINLPSVTTADRTIYWRATTDLVRNDFDA